ncbi:FAD:protein FMN transferase [Derxia lacustris]|uniref:FAD:protein FMN transferase n=1 Tax=Derxia lacustris TaxID=764842 RepID=UPI0015938C7C|nr:FAD:protein FMN transferase [Derxia lacustris]
MQAQFLRRARPALGTRVEVAAVGPAQAVERAFAAVERVQRVLSAHDPASDIGRFNAAQAGPLAGCDPWTLRLLALADRLRADSAGVFDIALGTAGGVAGYRLTAAGVLVKTLAGVRLDAGGIAKGFAVDAAIAALRAGGCRAGWVEAGGDLRVFGDCARDLWLRDARPGREALTPLGRIERGAVASSQYLADGHSAGKHDWLHRPVGVVHDSAPVAVIASRCAIADALTKPAVLGGPGLADLLRRWGATVCRLDDSRTGEPVGPG